MCGLNNMKINQRNTQTRTESSRLAKLRFQGFQTRKVVFLENLGALTSYYIKHKKYLVLYFVNRICLPQYHNWGAYNQVNLGTLLTYPMSLTHPTLWVIAIR